MKAPAPDATLTKLGVVYKLTDTTKLWKERTIALQTAPVALLHYYKSAKDTSKPAGSFALSNTRVRVEAPMMHGQVKGAPMALYPFALFKRSGGDLVVRFASSEEFVAAQWVLALSESIAAAGAAQSRSGGAVCPLLSQARASAVWVGAPLESLVTQRDKLRAERSARKEAKVLAKDMKKADKLAAKAAKLAAKAEKVRTMKEARSAGRESRSRSRSNSFTNSRSRSHSPPPLSALTTAVSNSRSVTPTAKQSTTPAMLERDDTPALATPALRLPQTQGELNCVEVVVPSVVSPAVSPFAPLRALMRGRREDDGVATAPSVSDGSSSIGSATFSSAPAAVAAAARGTGQYADGDAPLDDFVLRSLPPGLRVYALWMRKWRHLLLPALLAFTLFFARDQLPFSWPVALACVGSVCAYTLVPPAVLGKSASTAAAKLAIASWSAPSDPKLYATLEVDASAAIDWIKRSREASALNCARGAAPITLTHIVIKAVGLALHEDKCGESALNGSIVCGDFYPRKGTMPLRLAVTATSRSGATIGYFGVKEPQTKSIEQIARSTAHGVSRLLQRHDEVDSVEQSSDVLARLLPLWLLGCVESFLRIELCRCRAKFRDRALSHTHTVFVCDTVCACMLISFRATPPPPTHHTPNRRHAH